jgi:predicted nucleic acid-binding protein
MFLLDTNVISELRKVRHGRTDPRFIAWSGHLRWSELFLSTITIYELEAGISRLEEYDHLQALALRAWFRDKVLNRFEQRILPVDVPIAIRSGRLQLQRTRQVEDTLIAATAQLHRLTLVTRNLQDFDDTGTQLLNPWNDSAAKLDRTLYPTP